MDKTSADYMKLINDVNPKREKHWQSIFLQASIPACLEDVQSVLEFGPGRGLLGAILRHYNIDYESSDVADHGAKPEHLHAIMDFPAGKTYDLVCAFEALEHNPPETFVPHLQKMADLSNKYVYISMPYSGRWFSFNISLNLPRINRNFIKAFTRDRMIGVERPVEKYRKSETPYSHHWFEIGDPGFGKKDVCNHAKEAGLEVKRINHSVSFPYHVFFLMEKM